jgi:beta-mannanase
MLGRLVLGVAFSMALAIAQSGGNLSQIPISCTPPSLWIAGDQPPQNQLYVCDANGVYASVATGVEVNPPDPLPPPPPPPPPPPTDRDLPAVPSIGAYLGIETNNGYSMLTQLESLFGRQFAILHTNWNDGYQYSAGGYVKSINAIHDTIPMLTLATTTRTLAEIKTNIINPKDRRPNYQNSPDSLFKSWADGLKSYGKPVFLRFNHEMNGNWYSYCFQPNESNCKDKDTGVPQTAADFVAAWRHAHDIFLREGVTNVAWVWCPNILQGAGPHQVPMSSYYPGDAYVDWTCYDGYDWNNPPKNNQSNDSFTTITSQTYNQIKAVAPDKPMMIGEFNTDLQGDPSGNKKGAWLIDAYQKMQTNFPLIKAAILFDVDTSNIGQPDWRVENTTGGTNGLKQAIAPAYFLSH